MKNYPFHSWVPKPLGILILLLLFVPLFFSGGTYLSNINEMTGGLGALSEQFQLLNLCTFIGMSLVFPFMIPYLRERNAKHIFIGGFLLLIVFNGICARAESFPLLAICCFSIGVIRAMLVLNTTFQIAPYMLGVNTLDMFLYEPPTPEAAYQGEHMRTVLMPVLYCYILCIVQLSNYVSAWVAYEFRWEYTYFVVIGMLLVAIGLVLGTFTEMPAGRYRLPIKRLLDALLLAVAMGSVCYVLIFGKTYDWFDSHAIRRALAIALLSGGLYLWCEARRNKQRLLELGIFRYRYTWYSIGIFVLLLLVNAATSFVGSYLKMSTPAGNLESATISCWAIPGCIAGLVLSLVMVRKEVHFRYLYATGFGLILCANLYMYFHYQTLGIYEHSIVPTLFHYTGMLMLYSVTFAFAMKHIPTRYFVTWLFLMIAVRNVIAPAVGTSVYGNWLQERQQHYVTRLAQDVRVDDPRASFAMTAPVRLQATLVAMKDITGSTVWLCLGSMTLVLLIPYYKEERT